MIPFPIRRLSSYVPHITVFTASMGIMIIELVASRVVAKYFGNSLYTWTGVIGIVLGGISLGNYIGGKLADRFKPKNSIPYLLLIASLFVLVILLLDFLLEGILYKSEITGVTGSMVLRSFLLIFMFFFFPASCLGTISPVMAKFALESRTRIGNTVGIIYALSAIGSICGTFLSGYLLIPLLGIRLIICIVAFVVALLALLERKARWLTAVWLLLVAVLCVLLSRGTFDPLRPSHRDESVDTLYTTDSAYSHIKVMEGTYRGRKERVLVMNGLIHNRFNPEDSDDLIYDYEGIYAAFTDRWVDLDGGRPDFSTLTVGGGACLFPAYLDRKYPYSKNEIVEIDPEVVRVAYRYFDLEHSPRLEIIVADARNYINSIVERKTYDLVFLDAFSSYSIPTHLTTREFIESVERILTPRGVVAANIIDIFELGGFLAAYTKTLGEVFPFVMIFPSTLFFPQYRSTFVVLASRFELPLTRLRSDDGTVDTRKLADDQVNDLLARNEPRALTDDYAPVENLMAPVFIRSVK